MFLKKFLLITAVLSPLLFYSCSDDPSSIGADLIPGNDLLTIRELDSNTDTLFQSSSYFKKTVSLAIPNKISSPQIRLLIGKAENVQASSLIRFNILFADSIKDALKANLLNLTSAKIELNNVYEFGDTNSGAAFDFSVYEITSSWGYEFSSDSLVSLSYNSNDISSDKSFTDTLNTFNINNDVALSWLKFAVDSIANNGIYLKPSESSKKIAGFQSSYLSPSTQPYLIVVVEKPGVYVDTLTFAASSDLSVVTGELPGIIHPSIIVQSGLVINGMLKFDVSKIPPHSIINNAELTLNLDSAETVIGKKSTNTLLTALVKDSTQLQVDSTSIITFSKTNNILKATITSYVQKWLSTNPNEGILLFTRDQSFSADLFTLYGSGAERSLRPKLNIIYNIISTNSK